MKSAPFYQRRQMLVSTRLCTLQPCYHSLNPHAG